jgi:hypothetical protein
VAYDLGVRGHARELYDRLEPVGHMMVWNSAVAYNSIDHYLGGLAATLGEDEKAESHFERAIATAERGKAPLWLARTLLWYGRLLHRSGDRDRARELLQWAARLAREHGAAGVERDAGALTVG